MPEAINKYRIFLASPSDLAEEREAVSQVISELNLTYGRTNNLILELIKWETHSAPGISTSHIQGLINNDIGNYDLFIGLLWMRFGTQTKEYGSGTEEEFNIAHNKFLQDENSTQILFYFKTSLPKSLDVIDTDQFSKVRKFKSNLGEKNILHWEFNLKEDLERFLRLHIPTRIDNLRKCSIANSDTKDKSELETLPILAEKVAVLEDKEELGVLDYQEIINESLANSLEALKRISDATEWIGKEITKKANEIGKLANKSKNQTISIKVQRNLFNKTADVMNNYASRMEPDIPIYMNNFEKSIDSFSNIITIYKCDFENTEDDLTDAKSSLGSLLVQINYCNDNMKRFLNSIESLQRMSKELNNAKKNVSNILGEFINKLDVSYSIANELLKSIHSDETILD